MPFDLQHYANILRLLRLLRAGGLTEWKARVEAWKAIGQGGISKYFRSGGVKHHFCARRRKSPRRSFWEPC